MSKKEEFSKERFKQALDSTYKVISQEFDNDLAVEPIAVLKFSIISTFFSTFFILKHLLKTQEDLHRNIFDNIQQ